MNLKALSISGYTFSLRLSVFIEMAIDGYFGVSTKFKHVQYFPFDGQVMLSNIVKMHSGNTYFRWILMNFSIIYLIFESNKNTFK